MKYITYVFVLLKKLFVYKAGIFIAPLILISGIFYANLLTITLALAFYGFIILAFLTRSYTRNIVYNYVLQNDIWLPRLLERKPKLVNDKYILEDIHSVKERNNIEITGYIKYRKISKLEYLLARTLWKWVDDDSNHDTMDGKDRTSEGMVYGNTFDLGDVRGIYPQFKFKESLAWFIRNTGYNSNYMDEECGINDAKYFYHRFTTKYFDWHFGYIPYTNSERKGRMVWFTEDITRIDN